MAKVINNEKEFKKMKKEKVEEIVVLLDLFEGKISLTEILNTDISLLNQLRDAKLFIKKRQEAYSAAKEKGLASSKSQTITLTNPSTLKKGNS